MNARVVAVANQKGGVAKTTTTINLGACLALADQRVLLIDLDPQGNLTSGVGMKDRLGEAGTAYEAITTDDNGDPTRFIVETGVDHLHLLPATRDLTGAEIELVSLLARERRLGRFIDRVRDRYDYVLVDSPPSLGL